MFEKLPGVGKDKDENPESAPDDVPSDLTVEDIKENDDLSVEDLPREVKMRLLFSEAPTTFRQLQGKWENERIELFFLLFSILAATGMLVLIMFNLTYYVIAVFGAYAVIMVPLLYIHEEERYFQHDEELFE
jgi:hypothetical protein